MFALPRGKSTAPAVSPGFAPVARRVDLPGLTALGLEAVAAIFDKYVCFPSEEHRDAACLWVAHAHVYRAFDSTPRLSIRSEEPGSGKSRVLDIIRELVPDPLDAVCTTPAVLWHSLGEGQSKPTILIDEADTVFGVNGSANAQKALRSILDAGHRRGATVPRMQANAVKRYNVFAPVALAGLGRLPDTIATRSVEIVMTKPTRPLEQFRIRTASQYLTLTKRLLDAWGPMAKPVLEAAPIPDMPVENRDADVWEPLIQIGDLAGQEWANRARAACYRIVGQRATTSQERAVEDISSAVRQALGLIEPAEEVEEEDPKDSEEPARWGSLDRDEIEAEYDRYAIAQYTRALEELNGVLLNEAGKAYSRAGHPDLEWEIFQGPWQVARKYASEELLDWWLANGRETLQSFRYCINGWESDRPAAERVRARGHAWSLTRN